MLHLFPQTVSYNRFVKLQKSVVLHLIVFIKEVLLDTCTGVAYVDEPLYSEAFIENVKEFLSQETVYFLGIRF